MLRLFVGLGLPPERRLALSLICSGLPGVRWVDPGNFHVTLRFIGEVDEGVAEDIDEALAGIRAKRFQLSIAGLDVFGDPGKPRLLYAGVERVPELLELQQKVENALARIGLMPEGRRYVPHVTLANCKTPSAAGVHRFIVANNLLRLEPFEVESFQLVRSYLTKAGSIYEDVAEYPLKG
ncbi:MAG TPA: RNA 2',3'-cyclic phosphodiesterase [Stellaceae bacterium]|nr:RNA 2',3'-cyclic phosphodiesterase [Stellaceae bacterium]